MKTNIERLGITGAISFALSLLSGQALAAFNSGSTGADGAFNPTVDTQLQLPPSGILNYTSVNIPAGVTVTFAKNATNTPVTMLVSGDFVIAGTIRLDGTPGAQTSPEDLDSGQPGTGGPGGYGGGLGGFMWAPERNRRYRVWPRWRCWEGTLAGIKSSIRLPKAAAAGGFEPQGGRESQWSLHGAWRQCVWVEFACYRCLAAPVEVAWWWNGTERHRRWRGGGGAILIAVSGQGCEGSRIVAWRQWRRRRRTSPVE